MEKPKAEEKQKVTNHAILSVDGLGRRDLKKGGNGLFSNGIAHGMF